MAFAPPEDNSHVDRKPSPYPAPDLQFDKYARKEGKGKTKVYLKVGTVKDKTENYDALKHKDGECCLKKWEEACPAIGTSSTRSRTRASSTTSPTPPTPSCWRRAPRCSSPSSAARGTPTTPPTRP